MRKNLNLFERVIRLLMGFLLVFSALVFFENTVAKVAIALFGAFSFFEAASGFCLLYQRLGLRDHKNYLSAEAAYLMAAVGAQVVLSYEWLSAGWEKIINPAFVGDMGKTLGYFAGQNPFGWYKSFLTGFAAQNSALFGYLVAWGEFAIGLGLLVGAFVYAFAARDGLKRAALGVSILALLGGLVMNANFYLAAGWTGPGTHGINVVMFWLQAILFYVWLNLALSRK